MIQISRRANAIAPSATIAIAEKARELKEAGSDVISLAMGEPDFDTPQDIIDEAARAMKVGFTKYTDTAGISELKRAVINKMKRTNDIHYSPSEVIISAGAKQAVYNALSVLCDRDDEALIITPCWVSYEEQVRLTGAKPVYLDTHIGNGYLPNLEELESKISKRTKVLIINSPNNPTGTVYPKSLLENLARIAVKYQLAIISDEIYAELVFDDTQHHSIVSVKPSVREQALIISGVSKTYSMTGWRIGYCLGPENIIRAMVKFQGHITGNANSIAQKAAAYALDNNYTFQEWVKSYNERRLYCYEKLKKISGLNCLEPKGAFYLFPDCSSFIDSGNQVNKISSALDLAKYLLENAHVALVPGEAFKAPGHIRISYATSMENLIIAMDRVSEALGRLNYGSQKI